MHTYCFRNTSKRNDVVTSTNLDEDTGIYHCQELMPNLLQPCPCGKGLTDADNPEGTPPTQVGAATLYTRNGPIKCKMFIRKCLGDSPCEVLYHSEAEARGIFFYTKNTCVGDEVCWDFISLVKKSKISFTGFCTEMSRRYKTTNTQSAAFMSPNTFIALFFSWIAAFQIDFRAAIDPYCGYSPEMLACDGTHIGVSVKHMLLDEPVTKPDRREVLQPLHKRKDRVLLSDKNARQTLRYFCRKKLRTLQPKETVSAEEERKLCDSLLTYVEKEHNHLSAFLIAFLRETEDAQIVKGMAKVLFLLSGDAAISSVLPFACHQLILETCDKLSTYAAAGKLLHHLKSYCVEIADLLFEAQRHNSTPLCIRFVLYLLSQVETVHEGDRPTPPPCPIKGSYNPEKGTAYYFSKTGEQLRTMPVYDIKGQKKNYDDSPEVDEVCNKDFPTVSFGGYGYIFLWFCPIHGHTYGFHLIKGGEGRKDPFSSLFKYKEDAPSEIFFDFACQLSEYCLNREPSYFHSTRFWHDIFHSVTHKCGKNFKSARVYGMEGINTEICEQVNGYLQCVKYTASHLSQAHMMFFIQFFLYLWNQEKTKKYEARASVAIAGNM